MKKYLPKTKMNYRRNKQSAGKKFLKVGAVLIVLLALWYTPIGGALSNAIHGFATPIWGTADSIRSVGDDAGLIFISKKTLSTENTRLHNELAQVDLQLQERNLLFAQNKILLSLLGRAHASGTIVASVLAKPNRSLYDTLVLDVGEEEGVSVGYNVFYQGQAVGKIVQTYTHTSKVLLYSSSGESIDVVLSENGIAGTAIGQGGGTFQWSVPRDTDVSLGDIVVLPGIEQSILGVVEDISSRPSDPFKKILFKSPMNIFDIIYVEVVEDLKVEIASEEYEDTTEEEEE